MCAQEKQQESNKAQKELKALQQALVEAQAQEQKLQHAVAELQALQQTTTQRVMHLAAHSCILSHSLHLMLCLPVMLLFSHAQNITQCCGSQQHQE